MRSIVTFAVTWIDANEFENGRWPAPLIRCWPATRSMRTVVWSENAIRPRGR